MSSIHLEEHYVERVKEITRYGYVSKNSGAFVLKSSIEMAFELFKEHQKTRESEARYRNLLESIQAGIVVHGKDSRILDCNSKAEELLGLTREQLLGMDAMDSYWRLLREDGSPMPLEEFPVIKVLSEKKAVHDYVVAICRAGDEAPVWLTVAGVPELDQEGQVCRVINTFMDITERKQAYEKIENQAEEIETQNEALRGANDELATTLEKLRESEAILQAAMDQSQAGIAIADAPHGELRYVNDAGLLIRGGSRQEIVDGIGIEQYVASWQILHLDGTPYRPDEVPLARAVLYGETGQAEFMIRRDDNEDRIVLAHAAPIEDTQGKVSAGIVVFLDITEQKRAEQALKESESRYRLLAANLPDMDVYLFDTDMRFLIAEGSLMRRLGLSHEYFEGKRLPELLDKERLDIFLPMYEQALQGEQVDTEIFYDGLYFHQQVVPLRNESGEIIGGITLSQDITNRKRTEEALRRSTERLQILHL